MSASCPIKLVPGTSAGESASAVPQYSTCALLGWSNPVATGKVFITLIFGLILIKVNFVSIAFHALYIALLISAGVEHASKLITGQGFVTKYLSKPISHSETFKQSVLPAIGDVFEAAEAYVHKVLFAQDIDATLKAAGVSYILFKLTSWFSVYSIVFATVLLAFSFPPFYQRNQKEIDAVIAHYSKIAKDKTSEYTAVACKKVSPHIEALAKKSGPLGSFLQSKFPTRTAGSTVNSQHTAPVVTEPSTGVATGSSQFPLVPQSAPSGVTEVNDVKIRVSGPTL